MLKLLVVSDVAKPNHKYYLSLWFIVELPWILYFLFWVNLLRTRTKFEIKQSKTYSFLLQGLNFYITLFFNFKFCLGFNKFTQKGNKAFIKNPQRLMMIGKLACIFLNLLVFYFHHTEHSNKYQLFSVIKKSKKNYFQKINILIKRIS